MSMNKREIETAQRMILAASAFALALTSLSLGWFYLLDYLGAPRGLWQPLSLSGILIGAAYVVLEIIKRRK